MTDIVWIPNVSSGSGPGVFRYDLTAVPDAQPFFTDTHIVNVVDLGVVLNGSTYEVWISNAASNVLRFRLNGTYIGSISNADFQTLPLGIFQIPSTGEVWIASGNNPIDRYNPDGTLSGAGSLIIDADIAAAGFCVGPDGAIWISNLGTGSVGIYRANADGTPYSGGNITSIGPGSAYGIVRVGATVWTCCGGDISVLDSSGAVVHTITALVGDPFAWFELELVNGEVWANGGSATTYRFDPATYALIGSFANVDMPEPGAVRVVPYAPLPTSALPPLPFPTPVTLIMNTLTAPILVSPQLTNQASPFEFFNGAGPALATTDTPTYTWLAVTGADKYHIQVSPDPTFATTLHDVSGITGLTYTEPTTLADQTEYYWRVRAINSTYGLVGPWSYIGFFVVLDPYDTVTPISGATITCVAVVVLDPFNPPLYKYTFYYVGDASYTMLGGETESGSLYLEVIDGGSTSIDPRILDGMATSLTTSTEFAVPEVGGDQIGAGPPAVSFSYTRTFTYYRGFYPIVIPTGAVPAGDLPTGVYATRALAYTGIATTFTIQYP